MRISFLGTSHGLPEPNRQCSCVMLEISGQYYFVDMGMLAINELITRGIPVDAVKGVFITHMHGDHTNGLPGFVDLLTWYYKTANPTFCIPQQEGIDALKKWVTTTVQMNAIREFNFVTVHPGVVYEDNLVKVTAIPTRHCDRSFAYLIEAEGKRLLFTGDLKHPSEDFPDVVKQMPLDVVVCEAAHFSPANYLPIFQQGDIKTIFITHYAPKFIGPVLQLRADFTDAEIRLPHDGLDYIL